MKTRGFYSLEDADNFTSIAHKAYKEGYIEKAQ